jgi:hypothetical protein
MILEKSEIILRRSKIPGKTSIEELVINDAQTPYVAFLAVFFLIKY